MVIRYAKRLQNNQQKERWGKGEDFFLQAYFS